MSTTVRCNSASKFQCGMFDKCFLELTCDILTKCHLRPRINSCLDEFFFFTDISDLLKVALLQRLLGSDHFNPFFGDYRKDKSSDLSTDYKEGSLILNYFTLQQ